MKGIFTLLAANLKKRLAQSILTLIIIAVAAVMFTTATAVATSLRQPFEAMYEKLNASQLLLLSRSGIYDNQAVADWWEKQEGISVQMFKYHHTSDRLVLKGETLNEGIIFFTEKSDSVLTQDKLEIMAGENKNCPAPDEIWICRSFADKRKLSVGDSIDVSTKLGLKSMKISAIVADAQFGSPSMGVLRIWIAPGELDRLFDANEGSGDFIGLRFDDYSKKDVLWEKFEKEMNLLFTVDIFDYELISSAYLTQFQIMGAILNVFAFILLIIAVCIIAFTISAAVAADVKTIGILKAQGYTPKAMTWLYAIQYIILSVIAVPIGIFASGFLAGVITEMQTSSMGVTSVELSMLIPGLFAFVIIVSFVGLFSLLSARKAGNLKPVSAMREELAEVKQVQTLSFNKIRFLPVPVLVAIRQIFTQKWQSMLLALGSLALAGAITYSVNIYHTFDRMYDNANDWGFDKRNDTITFKEGAGADFQAAFDESIKADKRIKQYVRIPTRDIPVRIEGKGNAQYKDVMLFVYDGDIGSIGCLTMDGNHPVKDNEIGISVNVQKTFHVNIGDYLTVDIAGKKMDLLISSIFQTTNRMGWAIRAQASLAGKILPDFQLNSYAVIFNSAADRTSFVDEYTRKFAQQLEIQPYEETLEGFIYSTRMGINSFVVMLGTIFILVMLIVIFNSTLVGIYREKRVYGILKSMGLTPVQVRMSIVWRTVILTGVGAAVGIPLSLWGSQPLMNMMLSQMGIVKFPMLFSLPGMLLIVPVCLLIGFISSWIPSKRIHHITPRNLIIE